MHLVVTADPRDVDSYLEYLIDHDVLGHGFEYHELVKPVWRDIRGRFRMPPRTLWPNMVNTLALANAIRQRWIARGGTGLRVAAAYRPTGGARYSQHKCNAALDLDILRRDRDDRGATAVWYKIAAETWRDSRDELRVGLGLYCPDIVLSGARIHIDTLWRSRTWQLWRGRYINPPAAMLIAA